MIASARARDPLLEFRARYALPVLVLAYAGAVTLGRMSRLPGTSLAMVWPAAGVAFVWMLWALRRSRRALLVNALLLTIIAGVINWATGADAQLALALAAANVAQALVECAVLAWLRPDAWRLRRPMDLAAWVVACLVGALVGSCIGPTVLAHLVGGDFWALAGAWTLRNATNTFVFGAPILLVAANGVRSLLPPLAKLPELVLASVVVTAGYALVFGFADGMPLGYLVLPLSMWFALRFSTTVAAAHVLSSAVLVIVLTWSQHGPFAAVAPATRVLLAQAFVAVVGLVTLLLALHRDERRELVGQLRAARAVADERAEELHEASVHKSRFLATMSHEIRTPLNGVLGFASMIADAPADTAVGEWARAVDTSGRALLDIVNDVLDLAKIEAGGLELERIELDLTTVAREALLPSQIAAHHRGIDLRVVLGDGLHRTRLGDPGRLRQILTNLVANAVKFTDEGSVTVTVVGAGETVELRVADTGIGMDDEQAARVFDPFQQAAADTTRRFGGTGLGLSIAQTLTEAMGGTIGVTSALGEGTTVTVKLPMERVLDRALDDEPPVAAVGPARGLRVLVADDDEVNQLVARALLTRCGLEVELVSDGQDAVEAALSGRYEAVFMDCRMPVLDGLEATRRIREAGQVDLPIVAMTASAFEDDRRACLTAGMDDFLPKPWRPQELTAVLQRLAERGRPVGA